MNGVARHLYGLHTTKRVATALADTLQEGKRTLALLLLRAAAAVEAAAAARSASAIRATSVDVEN